MEFESTSDIVQQKKSNILCLYVTKIVVRLIQDSKFNL
jgi:hypothetical protein